MDINDYATSVNNYADSNELSPDHVMDCIDGVIKEHALMQPISHADMYEQCMKALSKIYEGTGVIVLYQDDAEQSLTDAQFKDLKDQIEENWDKNDRPLLLEGELKVDTIDLSAQIEPLLKAAEFHKDEMIKARSKLCI